ncbi:MAG: phenylpropionate dioxygenase-like ring-hydroxylating dioxygenase large terminal subunit [Candidatus Azotimanducaceae bacterium]|jgi:phenylpropionate dioxygenase-like ring-hydroxylating dioxygenase large terminal subunit
MEQKEIDNLRLLMEFEAERTAPPEGFPPLPDIPAGRYIDSRFFELEKEHLWSKAWLFAGHIDEIPEPGSFKTWDNTGDPLVLVHSQEGKINAFFNTCRHRGAPVVMEPSGKKIRLTCIYHGWSYDLDGNLKSIRDSEDFSDLDMSCRSLISVRCERFGNLIFINFDENAPTLTEWLGPIADEWKEFQFDRCRMVGKQSFDLDCNWKIAMESNTEVYHVKSIHADTVAPILDDRRNVNSFYANGHGRMVAPSKLSAEQQKQLPRSIFPEIETVGEIGRTCTQSYGIFPNWVSPLNERTLPPLLFWPTSIKTTRFEVWTFCADWGEGEMPEGFNNIWTSEDDSELGKVLLEDTQFGTSIQKSMESRGFRGVPLSYQEARIYHWNQWADRMIGIERIPEELRVAQVMGDEWLMPNDPRLEEIGINVAAS